MGHQLIREPVDGPDGEARFCIFSSIVDNIVVYNASYDEVVKYYEKKAKREARETTKRWLDEVLGKPGSIPVFRQMTYNEMLQTIMRVHGEREAEKVGRLIDTGTEDKL